MHRWIVALVVLLFAVPSSAKTLEEVEKAVIEAMGKHKSIRCKVGMFQHVDTGMLKSKTVAHGTFETKKYSEDKYRSRVELKGAMKMEVMGKAQKQTMEMLAIDDGQHQYTLMVTGQKRTAIKGRRDPNNVFGGKQFFELQREKSTLKLLPDEKVGDADCYVIESKLKQPIPMFSRSVTYIDKKTGITRKMIAYDKLETEMMTAQTSDIRLNVDVPDDRFVFKVPKGVILRDMTKVASRPASRPAGWGVRGDGKERPDLEAILKRFQEQERRRDEQREKK
jgi:outer membrane lipoprotein-sorting protein